MDEYLPTIGLEIHAELRTQTKMFCDSKNDPNEKEPNVNICPVCMAHPGTLPVINREAIKSVLKVGIALQSKLADYTEFDRKNYFYPDLPKGYQLSQYEYPLISGGELAGVEITRVHLEEDTASSTHDEVIGETLVDYNRAGVPLMELVTEPVIHSAEKAGEFARELQLLLRTLGVSNANMEKGEMRVEANVSIGKAGVLGTKVEIKNLNSFNAMERAVKYEIERQKKILDAGGTVEQQTLGWDDKKQSTFPQRIKEGSADYRYFPDPDLPSLKLSEVSEFALDTLMKEMPELPASKQARFEALGIKPQDAKLFVRVDILGDLFEESITFFGEGDKGVLLAANYIANDLVKLIRDTQEADTENNPEMPISARNFNKIIELVKEGRISSRAAKDTLEAYMKGETSDPVEYVTVKGLIQDTSSDKLSGVVAAVIANNPGVVEEYRGGKVSSLEYLLGQCMKELRGAADPSELRRMLQAELLNR